MKMICFGDSNTYGYDPRSFFGDRYDSDCRWVDILAEKHGFTVINAGENGREIPHRPEEFDCFDQMMNRFGSADLLIILLGSNDLLQGNTADTTAKRMDFFLNRIKMEKSKILLIAPPPMQPGQWVNTQELIKSSVELKWEYRDVAKRLKTRFADAEEWNVSLAFDGVHFTEEGHRAFARGLFRYLTEGE